MNAARSSSLFPVYSFSNPLGSQVHHVNVGSQTDVVRQIPADMIRIVVDYDLVGIPQPVVAVPKIIRSDGEIEPAEPEAVRTSSNEPPDVSPAEAAGEVTVLPRMIQVVISIHAASVMTDPALAIVYVRSIGMPCFLTELPVLLDWSWSLYPRRSVRGNILVTSSNCRFASGFMFMLCEC